MTAIVVFIPATGFGQLVIRDLVENPRRDVAMDTCGLLMLTLCCVSEIDELAISGWGPMHLSAAIRGSGCDSIGVDGGS